jgi:hypothetical protein
MAFDDTRRFRMTIWPGVPLPLPPLLPRRVQYRPHGSGLALVGTGGWVDIAGRIGEVYLELYDLDLEDDAALIGFANKYGTPSGALVHSALAGHSWFSGLFSPAADLQARDALIATDPALSQTHDPAQLPEITTLASFRFAAQVLRDLTDAWRIVNADPDLEPSSHRWQLDYPVSGDTMRSGLFALELLTRGLTPLLARFHPYVTPTTSPPDDDSNQGDELEHNLSSTGVLTEAARSLAFAHLAEFCALELFNHAAASEVYRLCANETCRRVFVRQYGRAAAGQTRREGIMYCSYHCAQAQAQRNYRRRRTARAKAPPPAERTVRRRAPQRKSSGTHTRSMQETSEE